MALEEDVEAQFILSVMFEKTGEGLQEDDEESVMLTLIPH